ncbi:MAG TPA: DUF1343 domain-containing protein [Longimicrobiales bacterium]
MTRILAAAALVLLCGGGVAGQETQQKARQHEEGTGVVPGVVVFMHHPPKLIEGKRIGLITNQSGRDLQGNSTVDLINGMKNVKLVALFSPEHGIRGVEDRAVSSTKDEKTGLPINSLYGATYKPTAEMLKDVDVLVYDIQDIGVRQYTFESTMANCMKAAAEKGIPFIVLDRPNPVTGTIVEGNVTDPKFLSFVGIYPVASRHGLTVGELARYYNATQKIGAKLTVIPVERWRRSMWWDQTGLPWINPSPNIRRPMAEIIYPGSVFFEGTNLSEGRGSSLPLEQVGAPWLKNVEIARAMNAMKLPGVNFEAVDFAIDSTAGKYKGQTVKGIRFAVTNRDRFRPVSAAFLLMNEIRKMQPDEFKWRGANQREPNMLAIDRLSGTDEVRKAIDAGTMPQLLKKWDQEDSAFLKDRQPFLLYK